MRRALALFALLVLLAPAAGRTTEEYAARTGKKCAACHVDHGGGGDLTGAGRRYAAGGYVWPPVVGPAPALETHAQAEAPSPTMRAARALLGLLHLLAAVAWFGTIFYVHLVLKPGYAKGGLPRTEARIAWGSILVLALTGAPLLLLRYPDPSLLLQSRSGVLLLAKIGVYLLLVLSAGYVTLALSPKLKKLRAGWQQNDGTGGRPAWVKVGDTLHDLTGSPRWKEGLHMNRHQAGQDLTRALANAPHGPEVLTRFPSFSLKDGSLTLESSEVKLLVRLAYANLFAALAVVIFIALRRWG